MTSCLPHWISSVALPMQCADVAAGRRDRIVDALDLEGWWRVRPRGPSTWPWAPRRGRPFSGPSRASMSAAQTMARVDGPPEPMMMPVRSLTTSLWLRDRRRGSPDPWRCSSSRRRPSMKRFGLRGTMAFPVDVGLAMHLACETKLGVLFGAHDAGFALAQRGQHFLGVVSDRGHDAHAGDDHASHRQLLRCTRRA